MSVNDIDVDILVNGRPVRKYSHQGRVFVEAKHWTEYSIKIRNNSYSRRLAIVTVDGLNVLDGEAGGTTKTGYVINGYSSMDIKGFRTSNEVVHPFKFNRKERSYASKSDVTEGDTRNCGVIGVEVFDEKVKRPTPQIVIKEVIREVEKPVHHWWPLYTWTSANPKPDTTITYTCSTAGNMIGSAGQQQVQNGNMLRCMNFSSGPQLSNAGTDSIQASAINCCQVEEPLDMSPVMDMLAEEPKRGFDMGTEFSEREVADKVHDVEFEIGYRVFSLSIYYASKESLVDMGVPVNRESQVAFPEPFPTKFCRPPTRR